MGGLNKLDMFLKIKYKGNTILFENYDSISLIAEYQFGSNLIKITWLNNSNTPSP